ncbi:MAG: HlyD family efflux transporter periplasmic adaptor subunit [Odoribacteraceae bacterium]|jgi:HlyD family secretion protein|nr:HlyD family efflux transporter periplasmic adaptor subunit [Odoribacteraceae bacterium]
MKTIITILTSAALLPAIALSCGEGQAGRDATGTFEATEVTVSTEIGGKILRLSVEEGQTLQAGVPVGLIDTTALALERELLRRKVAVLESRRVNIPLQVAATRQEIMTTRRERRRFDNLARANAVGRKQVDDLDARLAVLERELSARVLALEDHNRGVEAEIAAIEVEIARVNDRLSRCLVSSPLDGTVLVKHAEAGEVALAGKALFKVADLEHMILRAYVPSSLLSRVQPGQAARVFIEVGDGERREYAGRVAWISGQAGFTPKNVQTSDERANQVYAVKVATRNDGWIRIGMYGEVIFDEHGNGRD